MQGRVVTLVLAGEGDADVRFAVQWLLVRAGHKVMVAADGVVLVAMAGMRQPDIVVVDQGRPGVSGMQDGQEVCRVLRGDLRTAQVPILVDVGSCRAC